MQEIPWALSFARLKAGSNIAARIAMIAITTSNSIKVNPPGRAGGFNGCKRNGWCALISAESGRHHTMGQILTGNKIFWPA